MVAKHEAGTDGKTRCAGVGYAACVLVRAVLGVAAILGVVFVGALWVAATIVSIESVVSGRTVGAIIMGACLVYMVALLCTAIVADDRRRGRR